MLHVLNFLNAVCPLKKPKANSLHITYELLHYSLGFQWWKMYLTVLIVAYFFPTEFLL